VPSSLPVTIQRPFGLKLAPVSGFVSRPRKKRSCPVCAFQRPAVNWLEVTIH
jgi:hypothetical protein